MPRTTTTAKINLANLRHNYAMANRWAPHSQNMAVIKANAYGHGAIEVANELESDVPAFGVAIFEEAIALRANEIKKPILVLQGVRNKHELIKASDLSIWLTVHNLEQLELILNTPLETAVTVWLKLDTGMHRLGLNQLEFEETLESIAGCPWIDDQYVISSHFSCASELGSPEPAAQLDRFNSMLEAANLPEACQKSLANSPAIVSLPESNFSWNRPGLLLYGLPLFDQPHSTDALLRPVMTFETEVVAIRAVDKGESVGYGKQWTAKRLSIIATLSVGYGDGYPRQARNGTPVLIHGQRAPLAGVVSMDLISVDITDIDGVKIGDKAELWGANLCANEVAGYAGTIGYDLVTGVSSRVPRKYKS